MHKSSGLTDKESDLQLGYKIFACVICLNSFILFTVVIVMVNIWIINSTRLL